MSHLYTVFTHPQQGQWGFAALVPQGQVRTVAIGPNGRARMGTIEPIKLAPLVQQHLRAGYRKGASRYLLLKGSEGDLQGEFVSQHPELAGGEGGELLLIAAVPPNTDMAGTAEGWRERLGAMPGGGRAREAWLRECSRATTYVAVKTGDVRVVLLVAQWARDNKLVLVSSSSELPLRAPGEQGHAWRDWLAAWFQRRDIDQALTDFGWSPDQPIGDVGPVPEEPKESVDADAWLALARQASF